MSSINSIKNAIKMVRENLDLLEERVDLLDINPTNRLEIIKLAIEKDIKNIKYIDNKFLLENLKINHITVLLNKYPLYLEYLPERFRAEEDYCRRAVLKDFKAIEFVLNKKVLEDKTLFLIMLDKDGMLLEYASESLRNDFEIVITAVTQNKEAKKFITKKLSDKIISMFN